MPVDSIADAVLARINRTAGLFRYLHPVTRRRRDHWAVATCRLPEDICNDWTDEKVYREPLRALVEAQR